ARRTALTGQALRRRTHEVNWVYVARVTHTTVPAADRLVGFGARPTPHHSKPRAGWVTRSHRRALCRPFAPQCLRGENTFENFAHFAVILQYCRVHREVCQEHEERP